MRPRAAVIAGAAIAVVACVLGVYLLRRDGGGPTPTPAAEATTISCIGGSEKSGLMADDRVKAILRDKYDLVVDFQPLGSYDQVQLSTEELAARGVNCLWPSSASAQLVFEQLHPSPATTFKGYATGTVLQSPEVIYAGPAGTDALIAKGVVEEREGGTYFIVDMKTLLNDYVINEETWEKLGAVGIGGPVIITSTDPAKSNSGFTLAQLELNILSTEDVYQAPTVEQAAIGLPLVRKLYDAQGLQALSSDAGFDQWLLQGAELHAPLYAGYENQVIQKVVQSEDNPAVTKQLLDNVRILYPEPTIYSDHPILALNSSAARLIEAMKDSEIQTIAWQTYGFRSGVQIGLNDVTDFADLPLAEQVRSTSPPNATVTLKLLACIQKNQCT